MGLFDAQAYSEKVAKLLGMDESSPARKMLLKGALPVVSPGEMVAALAYLADQGDDAALQTLRGLPDNVLMKALEEENLPGPVVDFLLQRVECSPKVVRRLIHDERLSNEALARYAKTCSQDMALLIGDNEQRLISAPEVIESLYLNPNMPMSRAMRLVELAVRNGLELSIDAFDEMKRSLQETEVPEDELERELQEAAMDQQFKLAQKEEEDEDNEEKVPLHMLPVPVKIRLAIMGSKFQRSQLLRDSNKVVAMAAIKSPTITEQEVEEISKSRQVIDDVIRYISRRRDWLKSYKIRLNLVMNPKTPIPTALNILSQLRLNDLKAIARSHNVPAAVREAAQKRLKQGRR